MYVQVIRVCNSLALCILILLAARLQGICLEILMEVRQ